MREGYRLERPDHCHPQLYQLAAACWSADPAWRPAFSEIHSRLQVGETAWERLVTSLVELLFGDELFLVWKAICNGSSAVENIMIVQW